MSVEFRILGPLEAGVDGSAVQLGGPRQRAVLAILLAQANEVVPVERLIDGVWDEDPPETAANILQGYVSQLRKLLGGTRSSRAGAAMWRWCRTARSTSTASSATRPRA